MVSQTCLHDADGVLKDYGSQLRSPVSPPRQQVHPDLLGALKADNDHGRIGSDAEGPAARLPVDDHDFGVGREAVGHEYSICPLGGPPVDVMQPS